MVSSAAVAATSAGQSAAQARTGAASPAAAASLDALADTTELVAAPGGDKKQQIAELQSRIREQTELYEFMRAEGDSSEIRAIHTDLMSMRTRLAELQGLPPPSAAAPAATTPSRAPQQQQQQQSRTPQQQQQQQQQRAQATATPSSSTSSPAAATPAARSQPVFTPAPAAASTPLTALEIQEKLRRDKFTVIEQKLRLQMEEWMNKGKVVSTRSGA